MLKPKLYSIETTGKRKMATKGVSLKNIEPIPHSKFEEILENASVSEKRPQVRIRKVGDKMCTVKYIKDTISAFEQKRFYGDSYSSKGYHHPDIRKEPGGSECCPVRFEVNVERLNGGSVRNPRPVEYEANVDRMNDAHIMQAELEDPEMYEGTFLNGEGDHTEVGLDNGVNNHLTSDVAHGSNTNHVRSSLVTYSCNDVFDESLNEIMSSYKDDDLFGDDQSINRYKRKYIYPDDNVRKK